MYWDKFIVIKVDVFLIWKNVKFQKALWVMLALKSLYTNSYGVALRYRSFPLDLLGLVFWYLDTIQWKFSLSEHFLLIWEIFDGKKILRFFFRKNKNVPNYWPLWKILDQTVLNYEEDHLSGSKIDRPVQSYPIEFSYFRELHKWRPIMSLAWNNHF